MNRAERDEVIRLSEALLDGRLERMELARLEELIESSDEALDLYLEVSDDVSVIQETLSEMAMDPRYVRERAKVGLWRNRLLAVAALVVLFVGGWVLLPKGSLEVPEASPRYAQAKMSGGVGVRWAEGQKEYATGDLVVGETVEIEQGALEITCDNGIVLLVEGPASFRLSDSMNMRLDYGSLVAEVPREGRGFTVEYGKHRLIDHGTKFGMQISRNDLQRSAEIAVFQGEVEVLPANNRESVMLGRYDAVVLDENSETGVYSVPLDREKFLRELPLAEIPWQMPSIPLGKREEFEFDVSSLVRGAGRFFAVFKWMLGEDGIIVSDVELLCDGEVISRDPHDSRAGKFPYTKDNAYWLDIPEGAYRNAHWTLKATVYCPISEGEGDQKGEALSDSRGILYFDHSAYLPVSSDEFLGRWRYIYNGKVYERELFAGGRAVLRKIGGWVQPNVRWWVEGDVMHMYFPENKGTERHLLRGGTLLFIDRPYRNAHKYEGE